MFAGDKGEEEVHHDALAEHGPEEEEAGAAPSGPALSTGLPAGGQAVLPACKALPASLHRISILFPSLSPCNSQSLLTFNRFPQVFDTV